MTTRSAMTGQEFRERRVAAGLSVRKAAEALGVAPATIQRWQLDTSPVPPQAEARIRALAGEASSDQPVARTLGAILAVLELITRRPHRQGVTLLVVSRPAAGFAEVIAQARQQGARYQVYEDELTALFDEVPNFPERLTPAEQGAFWLGYYARRSKGPEPRPACP